MNLLPSFSFTYLRLKKAMFWRCSIKVVVEILVTTFYKYNNQAQQHLVFYSDFLFSFVSKFWREKNAWWTNSRVFTKRFFQKTIKIQKEYLKKKKTYSSHFFQYNFCNCNYTCLNKVVNKRRESFLTNPTNKPKILNKIAETHFQNRVKFQCDTNS